MFSEKRKELWEILIFLVKLSALSIFIYIGGRYLDFTSVQNYLTHHLYHFFRTMGYTIERTGFNLTLGNFTFSIIKDCVGWKGILFFSALVISTSHPLKWKLNGLIVNLPLIFATNVSRIVFLALFTYNFGPSAYELLHGILWQASMIIAVLMLWTVWLRNKGYSLAPLTVERNVS
ncbi:MAG: exosortase/archaeosortase family protein [Candidatus Aenigmatarchaeota archaeon]